MEEISDRRWDTEKYVRAADGNWENCVRSQGASSKGDWGAIVLCTMFLVSSSVNVFIFHSTWLDTFWTDLVYLPTRWVYYIPTECWWLIGFWGDYLGHYEIRNLPLQFHVIIQQCCSGNSVGEWYLRCFIKHALLSCILSNNLKVSEFLFVWFSFCLVTMAWLISDYCVIALQENAPVEKSILPNPRTWSPYSEADN